ncbi:MAG: ABC transporter six-transmembrane domain-containing protein, partial [Emcibacteraceae bacterium]|nr:ABC transporter six-transmembrane domain-containing protein [Emcibacteraceae bacterium]
KSEVQLSDTEAIVYGLIFTFLLGAVIFNLWYATAVMTLTVGIIFAVVTYSWEFVDSALMMPVTLQKWSNLSDISQRINQEYDNKK